MVSRDIDFICWNRKKKLVKNFQTSIFNKKCMFMQMIKKHENKKFLL